MLYSIDDLLPISGIQHYLFCKRQWALIEIEKQWQENLFTIEGALLHKKVDDPFENQHTPGLLVSRSVPVNSFELGLTGVCDVIEFHQSSQGVHLTGQSGTWLPVLIEYKRGQPKEHRADEAQICAQALCLEEMLSVSISESYLYYGKTRHRTKVIFDQPLRDLVRIVTDEMHRLYRRGHTPKVKTKKECGSCSLNETCLPALQTEKTNVHNYIQRFLESEM